MNWQSRDVQPEVMDQPDLDPRLHRQALSALQRLNWISRSAALLWPHIRRRAARSGGRPCRVLDLACGGGDVVLGLAARGRRARLPLQWHGVDISPTAIEYAQEKVRAGGWSDVTFSVGNVLEGPLPASYEVVTCTLFLHHLSEDQATLLLSRMRQIALEQVLVNDLRRTRWGELLVRVACRLLSRSPVVQVDGPLSARAAFSPGELAELAARAGLHGSVITSHWPQRMLLIWPS